MRLIKNSEPVFHTHKCPAERRGKRMTGQELHDFAVQVLMEEYGETKAEVVKWNKQSPYEADFYFEDPDICRNPVTGEWGRKRVNVLVVYEDDDLSGDISGIDTSWLVEHYRRYGMIPRVTFASAWCIYGNECPTGKPAICGGDFCFKYYSVSVIPDEKNGKLDKVLPAYKLAAIYAETWHRLDASIVEPYLDKDFHYASDWVFDEMPCRAEYMNYFRGKLEAIRKSNSRLRVAVACIHQTNQFGLMITQGDVRCFLALKTEGGRIKAARMQGLAD